MSKYERALFEAEVAQRHQEATEYNDSQFLENVQAERTNLIRLIGMLAPGELADERVRAIEKQWLDAHDDVYGEENPLQTFEERGNRVIDNISIYLNR